jgi:hypothetical protein
MYKLKGEPRIYLFYIFYYPSSKYNIIIYTYDITYNLSINSFNKKEFSLVICRIELQANPSLQNSNAPMNTLNCLTRGYIGVYSGGAWSTLIASNIKWNYTKYLILLERVQYYPYKNNVVLILSVWRMYWIMPNSNNLYNIFHSLPHLK